MTAPHLRPASPADRPLLERLWQLYAHDLSQLRGTQRRLGAGAAGAHREERRVVDVR